MGMVRATGEQSQCSTGECQYRRMSSTVYCSARSSSYEGGEEPLGSSGSSSELEEEVGEHQIRTGL